MNTVYKILSEIQENKKRGVISFDKGGSEQINRQNRRYRRICLMGGWEIES